MAKPPTKKYKPHWCYVSCNEWYILRRKSGQKFGPFNFEQLKIHVQDAQLMAFREDVHIDPTERRSDVAVWCTDFGNTGWINPWKVYGLGIWPFNEPDDYPKPQPVIHKPPEIDVAAIGCGICVVAAGIWFLCTMISVVPIILPIFIVCVILVMVFGR